jgi:AcrR family transcriptional regulator
MSQMPPAAVPRRDALNNRAQILVVARQAFNDIGVDVSMDAIAKRTGVGPGTLYRHFPNKDALLAALLVLHYDELDLRRAEIEAGGTDAGNVLERWIDALGDWMLAFEGLPEPLRAACRTPSPLTPTCQTVIETTDRILKAAQDEGFARRGMSGRDIFLGALAIAWASGDTTASDTTRTVLRTMLRRGWLEPG